MAEAMILSAIESVDRWLLKKPDIWEDNLEKLYRLIVGISGFGEDKKEMLHTSFFGLADSYDYYKLSDWQEKYDEFERNKENLFSLIDLRTDKKEKMYSLLVGMADFWEDNKEKLYGFLFRVADPCRDEEGVTNPDDMYNCLVEIADLWGDDEGELDKERLHNLLFEMLVNPIFYSTKRSTEKRRISAEISGLWKDKQPKLNKEKLYRWLATKADLGEGEHLFGLLFDVAVHQQNHTEMDKATRKSVEEAKQELGIIMDLITDKKLGEEMRLRYFISDVVDMAHRAQLLVQLKDSDPFAFLLEFRLIVRDSRLSVTNDSSFVNNFKDIVNVLREIKVSMLEIRVERTQTIGGLEGGENVLGLDKDVKLLLHHMHEITIIRGMVGIGKTTLARQLYNHTTIAQKFERRAWVCLSGVFSRKEILVSLIQQVVDTKELTSIGNLDCANYERLKQVLHQHLQGKRYFIVFDDVWEKATHLEYVLKALPKDKGQSRLLLTTRSINIALSDEDYIHKMKSMDDDKSWTLLLKTLFVEGTNEVFPKLLVKKARQILRKCNGCPLAIKEVGRKWAKKRRSGSEWEKIVESIDLRETLAEMESSYHNLSPELKSCFLLLGFFKEDATIRAKKLTQILIAGGLVSKFEEISGHFVDILLKESIIEVKDLDKCNYRMKTCRIHAIFHMLSIIKGKEELNFEILRTDGKSRPSHELHYHAIYCSREKLITYSSNQDKHVISLFFHGGGYFNSSPSYWKNFEQLKILDMEDFGLKILTDVIGMLIELRYLGLRNNYIQELPRSLGCLKKLEVLDIALNFMVKVADSIWEMDSLRHLYMCDITFHEPLKIDTLKNLLTLTYVSVDGWTYQVSRLKMMNSLETVGIEQVDRNSDVRMLFASLAELEKLYCLILRGLRFRSMPSLDKLGILENLSELKLDGLITSLPRANNFPPYIKFLKLINSCLNEDPMPILEKLPHLRYLKLKNAYTGEQMVISCYGFSNLNYLVIGELWHLRNVQVGKGAMKALMDMEINNCPYLKTLPEDIFPKNGPGKFKMTTTKKIANNIKKSSFISKISEVDIQP